MCRLAVPVSVPVLVVVLVLALALGLPAGRSAAGDGAAAGPSRDQVLRALTVLHGWDARRARAWAASDEPSLRALYVHGSSAGRTDARLLRSYTARGFVVRRLVTQVFGVRLLRQGPRTISLRVLDRVAGGVLAHDGLEAALPSSPPVVRRIDLVREGGDWRVAAVSGSG